MQGHEFGMELSTEPLVLISTRGVLRALGGGWIMLRIVDAIEGGDCSQLGLELFADGKFVIHGRLLPAEKSMAIGSDIDQPF